MRTPERADWNAPPSLDLGAHLSPEDGACLMEAVSSYAREPWGDAPACTHPLVAHVARLVNDSSSQQARDRLRFSVPTLATASSSDPTTYPRIVLACCAVASPERPSLLLSHLERAARLELARESRNLEEEPSKDHGRRRIADALRLLQRRLYRRGPAHRGVEVAVAALSHLSQPQRDRSLAEMLDRAVRTTSATCAAACPAGVLDADPRSTAQRFVRRG